MKTLILACVLTATAVMTAQAQEPWAWPSPAPHVAQPYAKPYAYPYPGRPRQPKAPGLSAPRPSSGSTYDWVSGDSYRWRRDLNGDTHVNRTNLRTGSTWRKTIKPDGSMTGFDPDMNPWRYNSRSRTYINYGTGKMCFGSGLSTYCY